MLQHNGLLFVKGFGLMQSRRIILVLLLLGFHMLYLINWREILIVEILGMAFVLLFQRRTICSILVRSERG